MMEEVPIGGDEPESKGEESYDSFDEEEGGRFQPPAERWAPIGASAPSPDPTSSGNRRSSESPQLKRLHELEEEQEHLNASLLALTTHFAQVQFRLQQICKAESSEKETLLKELEEFAFKGCPDIMEVKKARNWHSNDPGITTSEHQEIMEKQRAKQIQLIGQLKDQLEDLERFAYETGEGGPTSAEVMEKQRVVIEQLKDRMEIDLDDFDKLSNEDLQKHVDVALRQLINPMKVKEQLVQQLQTQITDLERFIEFLQVEGPGGGNSFTCTCDDNPNSEKSKECLKHMSPRRLAKKTKALGYTGANSSQTGRKDSVSSSVNDILQRYILAQLGCQSGKFQRNELKKTSKGNHWGDLRAELEVASDKLLTAVNKHKADDRPARLNPYNSDEEDVDDVFDQCHEEIVTVVRKVFCPALRDLLQHGMIDPTMVSTLANSAFGSMGCIPVRSRQAVAAKTAASQAAASQEGGGAEREPPHAWDIMVKFYEMKHGREFSEAPVRKLSQSFGLDNIGGKAVTSKQMLLSTIDNIMTSHMKLKRSKDAMFKAFVSAGLNHKKLVAWLRMILRTREIVDENYHFWSYVTRTGFDDSYAMLDRLNRETFHLPVDLAVRPFQHIKDAF